MHASAMRHLVQVCTCVLPICVLLCVRMCVSLTGAGGHEHMPAEAPPAASGTPPLGRVDEGEEEENDDQEAPK